MHWEKQKQLEENFHMLWPLHKWRYKHVYPGSLSPFLSLLMNSSYSHPIPALLFGSGSYLLMPVQTALSITSSLSCSINVSCCNGLSTGIQLYSSSSWFRKRGGGKFPLNLILLWFLFYFSFIKIPEKISVITHSCHYL